jgi:hypothetical protein
MMLTVTRSAAFLLLSFRFYNKKEKIACSMLLKGRHPFFSSDATDGESVLSTRWNPFVFNLRSYILQCPVPIPRSSLRV